MKFEDMQAIMEAHDGKCEHNCYDEFMAEAQELGYTDATLCVDHQFATYWSRTAEYFACDEVDEG